MARINIDDRLYADPRFKALCRLTGSEEMALGRMVLVFRMAQEYFCQDSKFIPCDIWDIQAFDYVEKVGLAERHEDGIYVKGSSESFDWLLKRKAAARAGGQKSAQIRKQKYGSAQPNNCANIEATSKQTRSTTRSKRSTSSNPLTLTPTLNTYTQTEPSVHKGAKKPKPQLGTHEVIARYCELFEQRYGIKAAVGGVEAGQLGRITKAHGKEQAIKIVEGYFEIQDQFIANQCHPVGMIEKQINKILVSQSKPVQSPSRLERSL
jgi:hypothetical protein